MVDKNNLEILEPGVIEDIINDLFKIFGSSSNEYLTKNECRNILNIVFESLFDEKLKTKNFNYIFIKNSRKFMKFLIILILVLMNLYN